MALLIGTVTEAASNAGAGTLYVSKFTCTASGIVDEIRVYSRVSGNAKVGIYSDNAGTPGTLLTVNNTGVACTATQWNSVAVPDLLITVGTIYWIAVKADTAGVIARNSDASYHVKYYSTSYALAIPSTPPTWSGDMTYLHSLAGYGDAVVDCDVDLLGPAGEMSAEAYALMTCFGSGLEGPAGTVRAVANIWLGLKSAFARYPLDQFGHDETGNVIWERTQVEKDLVLGDGADTDTFPAIVENEDHATAYYVFDGVDDHVSGWPEMPEEYTVVAAVSDSYPDGQPEIQSCNDDTLEALLTTPGGFSGNLHCLVIFDRVLTSAELEMLDKIMLRRLWRDTFVDPFTAWTIRAGDCVLCLYPEEEASKFDDYAAAIGSTDYSTGWDDGLTFPVAGAALVMDSSPDHAVSELTIFVEAPDFDLDATAETIVQNGTNYVLSLSQAAGVCSVELNGSSISFDVDGYRSLAVTAKDGEVPRFYLDGNLIGDGDSVVSIDPLGAGDLTVGNNTAMNNPFASVLKKLSIYARALSVEEIRAAHIMARAERQWT